MFLFSLKKLLPIKKIGIIDIGSYKVKVSICELGEKTLNVISTASKRQEKTDITDGEISNIEGVSKTINEAIEKASLDAGYSPSEFIINIPSSNIIGDVSNLTYQRAEKDKEITPRELQKIITRVEKLSIQKACEKIGEKTGYSRLDLKLITSSITKLSLDGEAINNPISFVGENFNLRILNIFTPISKYSNIKAIAKLLGKKVKRIVPMEYSLQKILAFSEYSQDDAIILDIGDSKTRIIGQRKGYYKDFEMIDIGIHDLVKLIKKGEKKTSSEIINSIDSQNYKEEKREFLAIWRQAIAIALKDIYGDSDIPNKFFVTGGGNNNFIREAMKERAFEVEIGLKRGVIFIDGEVKKEIKAILHKSGIKLSGNLNGEISTGMASLLLSARESYYLEDNIVSKILKNVLSKINI